MGEGVNKSSGDQAEQGLARRERISARAAIDGRPGFVAAIDDVNLRSEWIAGNCTAVGKECVGEAQVRELDRGPGTARRKLGRIDVRDGLRAQIAHNRPHGPVKVSLPQLGLLCRFDGCGSWRLEEGVRSWIGGYLAGAGIDFGSLEGGWGLENRVPSEGTKWVGLKRNARGRLGGHLDVIKQGAGLKLLRDPERPDKNHSAKSKDGPRAAAKRCAAGSDLVVGKAEDPRDHNGRDQESPRESGQR